MSKSAMKRILCTAIVLVLPLVAAVQSMPQSAPPNVTLTGTVSCSVCRAKHSRPKLKIYTNLSCTEYCLANLGANYVLAVGSNAYSLEGDRNRLKKFAGGDATVTGTLQGTQLKVVSIESPHNNLRSEIHPQSTPNNGVANSALITANFSPHQLGRFVSSETGE